MKSRLLIVAGLLAISTMFIGVWQSISSLETQRSSQIEFVATIGEVKRLDEVLTMSARMAAAGGGQKYIERYNENVLRLDEALAKAQQFLQFDEAALHVKATNSANNALVTMETEALAFIDANASHKAWDILHSNEYTQNKRIYWEGMEQAFSAAQREITADYKQTELISGGMIAAVLILLATMAYSYLKYGSAREKQRLVEALTANRDELIEQRAALTQNEEMLKVTIADLKEARNKARAGDMAKSEFLANMSHEIRTPMNGVMGMAELLSSTDLDKKQQMFADVIIKSGASLLTIINDILDFSKLDAGQMELDPAPFRFSEAVEDVATLISPKVAEKDLELIVRIDPEVPTSLVGDAGRIRQIITNLLGNAVKFTEQGHILINVEKITGESNVEDKVKVRISVEDTGVGIPENKLRSVFEKFSQVDNSATRRHDGTGLGLSISAHLVELMGGKIDAKSVVGKGSTFWFDIELVVDHAQEKPRSIPVDITGSRVLIVDDNEVNRAILTEQLTNWGFDCAAASTGKDALAIMRSVAEQGIRLNAIILDYQMPEYSGGDVVKAMKADQRIKDIPVIMLTSVEETDEGRVFSSLQINAHLTKPARSELLLSTLVEVLQDDASGQLGSDVAAVSPAKQATDVLKKLVQPEIQQPSPSGISDNTALEHIDVLVCEDNEVNQIVFTQILQEEGLSFKIANNGQEGVALFQRLEPKIVLMDVSMPKMNGLDATKYIREHELGASDRVPIIGVTAHAIKGDKENCLNAGMDDYMSKPIAPEALAKKIRFWLNSVSEKNSKVA